MKGMKPVKILEIQQKTLQNLGKPKGTGREGRNQPGIRAWVEREPQSPVRSKPIDLEKSWTILGQFLANFATFSPLQPSSGGVGEV